MTLYNVEAPDRAHFFNKDAQGPDINVEDATVLGYNQQVEYFGSDIGFKKTISLDLNCVLIDNDNVDGVSPDVEAFFARLNTSQDYSNLYVNGVLQGAAKVVSFSVEPGVMVSIARCNISFIIYSTYEDLSALSASTYYKDYASAAPTDFGQILDSFSDTISLVRSNNSTTYNRSISISANKSLNIEQLGDKIRRFVRGVLDFTAFSFPDFSGIEPDINLIPESTTFKKFITETSDETSNTYTFQEHLEASNVADIEVADYSAVITHSYSRAENGVETVVENGALIGLLKTSRIDAAEAAYGEEVAAASARMRAFYTKVKMDDSADLNECDDTGDLLFLINGKSTNTFEGTISYSLSSNNDPKYKDGAGGECGAKWDYNLTLENDGVYETATEQGTINGNGNIKYDHKAGDGLERYPKYQSAKTFFEDEVLKGAEGGILNSRITSLIDAGEFSVSPKPTRRTQGHAPRQGVISYSRSFSNNPIYQLNDDTNLVKKIESNNTLNATLPIVHNFVSLSKSDDPDINRHVVQRQSTESLSTVSNSITAIGYRIDVADERDEIDRIGNIAKKHIGLIKLMDGDTVWLNSASFTFSSLNDVRFGLNTSYNKGKGACE